MPSLTCFRFRFTPTWVMIFLTILVVSFLTYLGFWQLQRAEEKSKMVQAEQQMALQQPIAWKKKQTRPLQYQRIQIQGHYLADIFLLDNQHHQHQFGYNVLSPLQLDDGVVVLVDRGWVAGDVTRRQFPAVVTPHKLMHIRGVVYFPSMKQWVLGPEMEQKKDGLTILETANPKIVRQLLQKKVYPFIIRLDKNEPYGYVREWAIVSMPPARHVAYAWQWFAMALVVFILFIALNLKIYEKTNN